MFVAFLALLLLRRGPFPFLGIFFSVLSSSAQPASAEASPVLVLFRRSTCRRPMSLHLFPLPDREGVVCSFGSYLHLIYALLLLYAPLHRDIVADS